MVDDLIQEMKSFGLVVDIAPRFDGKAVRYKMAGKSNRDGFMSAGRRPSLTGYRALHRHQGHQFRPLARE